MKKKIISAVLVVCMLMTCIVVANYSVTAVSTDKSQTGTFPDTYSGITANPYGMAQSNDDATILQAWNWSYSNIQSELDNIAKQGFNTIQISPPNEIKTTTSDALVKQSDNKNGWWMFYQPSGFQINQSDGNALGKKADLVAMVKAAHAKGIKVIADTVINHMGTKDNEDSETSTDPMKHVTPKAAQFEPEIYNNKLFHTPWFNMTYKEDASRYGQDESTYDLTRGCTSRLPDLKTEDSRVQTAIYDYLKELVDCGIDGFRIDAAKHIETPNDLAAYKSDFWPNTVGAVKTYAKNTYGKDLLSYGEILNNSGVKRMTSWYFPYMKVTNTNAFYSITGNVNGGTAASVVPQNLSIGSDGSQSTESQQKNQAVLWAESHDTYADGNKPSDVELNKRWAAMAARDGITSMYLARPQSDSQKLGVASRTLWYSSTAIKAVNEFNNVYSGQGEYLDNGSNVAVIGRGSKTSNGGAVLVNCNSGGSRSISNVPVHTMANGTYTDKVSGATFTVNNDKISGQIGGTGVAVLYSDDPMVGGTSSCYYTTDTFTATFTFRNVDSATYSVNGSADTAYVNGQKVTFGTSADVQGATYKVTLKGYVGSEVKTTATLTYTKKNPSATHTVTFKTNGVSGWSGTPKIYYWGGSTTVSWPGVAMSGSGGVYTYDLPSDVPNILFCIGSGSPQSVDCQISDDTTYTLQSTTVNDNGTTKYNVASEASGVPIEEIYYPGVDPQPTQT
ncbi:MAG: starch-binding protein, partial [Ruminococcus sp.]|nr:starch-binding protein [Ruminococcus sp.]